MFLAAHADRRCQIQEVATFFGISKDHLAKAARRLGQEGFIRTIRGVGGGLELSRSPEDIRLGDVIQRVEGQLGLLDCTQVEGVCRIQPGCKLKGVLAEAERLQREYLESVSLSDVIAAGDDLVQLTSLS
ncbi:MAG: Rrf2 family transcriptional regulator [Planctomycetaceae bacterium]|nr:Rrf2 family transcriptional regulator [Planctomycetaceae bacterium]